MDEAGAFFQKRKKQVERLPKWAWGSAVLACIILLAVILNPGRESAGAQAAVDPLQSPTSLAVDVFLKFSVVLGLIYIAYYLLRRWQGNRFAAGNRQLTIKETLHLSPRRSIHLVQAGNRTLLIGATDQAVSFLAEIDPYLNSQSSSQNPTPLEFASILVNSQQSEQK